MNNKMASTRSKQSHLGSAQWAQDERQAMHQAVSNELEDFYYSAYNEFDWLNEKMEEVFSKDARTLTDVFKTPGKLRGKTPRSVRKFNAITPRQPLADIFAPNAQSTAIKAPRSSLGKHPRLEFEEVLENQQPAKKHSSRKNSPQRVGKPGNTDSGYHGLTEDEMESHRNTQHTADGREEAQNTASHEDVEQSTDQSFSSARENVVIAQKAAQQQLQNEMAAERELTAKNTAEPEQMPQQIDTAMAPDEHMEDATIEDVFETDRPLQRKSSFNFSSLPAREPLLSKKSMGPRTSQYEGISRPAGSLVPRQTSSGQDAEVADAAKTSTQRLHERITLLGKTRETVLSKEPAPVVAYPELSRHQPAQSADKQARDRASDDWIKPSSSHNSTSQESASFRPQTATNSIVDVPAHRSLQPNTAAATSSTTLASQSSNTPAGSPAAKRQYEGPLSSSKNKLMSVFKMGRSLFASSASTSAAAKLEAHTTTPSRPSPTREFSNESSFSVNMPGALHSEATLAKSPSRPLSIMSFGSTRKARKSGEAERKKEDESRAQQKAANDLDKAREMERAKVAAEQAHARELKEREAEQKALEMKTKADSSKSALPLVGKLKSVSRPVRPVKEAAKEKPAPINVKVTSQLQHREEPPARAPSVRPSSAHSTLKSSTAQIPNSRVRALEAAQRKKDLEEKAKQKKAEQKKELERKRLAKQEEEERKAEQERRAEEQRRAHEAKIAAQKQAEKQAAEAKRRDEVKLEQQRREHQHRLEAQRQQEEKAKADELAEIIARERAQQQAQSRTDLTGTLRSLAQKTFGESSRPPIQMNPAKPPKRNLQDTDDQRVAQQSYQQDGAKRRKTDELDENGHRASVMAPPKRPSTIRKETMTRFPHGYSQAAPNHPPTSMFKSAVTNQYQPNQKSAAHPSQLVQMSNARIAFADQPQVAVPSGHPESSKHKTPVRPAPVSAKSVAKSSPMYSNGDNITLPEIATDSEEEPESDDEDNGFRAPSWVASPALRELIARQQLVDPETVFGPIGELKMEEVFKGAKGDRLKKFRDRGSSAAWVQNGDAVTSAEKQRDMEMRETIARQGHWSYQPGM